MVRGPPLAIYGRRTEDATVTTQMISAGAFLAVLPADAPAPEVPGTQEDWVTLVAQLTSETKNAYLAKPDFLLGHAAQEHATARDYAGRELLELVQNAADAATEAGVRSRVRIELRPDALLVANTGAPFSPDGVRSLMTPNTSDKARRKRGLIGAKGLGFRALLNWSGEPFISSGALGIGFHRRHALGQAAEIADRSVRLGQLLDSADPQVPVLAFPLVGEELNALDEGAAAERRRRALALRTEGYDTVVAAGLTAEKHGRALAQVREFEPSFLLFVDSIEEVAIQVEGEPELRWSRRHLQGDEVVLKIERTGDVEEQRWVCRRRTGQVAQPSSAARGYELALAFRKGAPEPGRLHAYFPTDLPLPFPVLAHATLELDSNRKSLSAESEVNDAVLDALAVFYAEFLVALAQAKVIDEPIGFLSRRATFPPSLATFEQRVYERASELPLIGTLAGRRVAAAATALGPKNYVDYLPKRLFGSLARCRSDRDVAVLERLKVGVMPAAGIVGTLVKADLRIDERAAAIIGIAKALPSEHHHRALLVDGAGRALTRKNTCFPPPASGRPPALPRWATAKFLDRGLWNQLVARSPGAARDRFGLLEHFGVTEFSAVGVITSLRRQGAQMLKGKADPDRIRRELLGALYALRQTVARDSAYPPGATEVRCQDGTWRAAGRTHLSGGYGRDGDIVQALYASQPALLVGSPEANGLPPDAPDLARFLRWIGVQTWPSEEVQQVSPSERDLVRACLPEIVDVSADGYHASLRKADLRWDANLKASINGIIGLDRILADASSDAILSWLALDERFDAVKGSAFVTTVHARQGRAQYRPYTGDLPDLVRHAIATRPWLRVGDGRKVAPRDSMVEPGRLAELFAVPGRPLAEAAVSFGMNQTIWLRGLLNAGVPQRLPELREADIYRLMASLEARKAGPDLVRRLYLQVLDLDGFEPSRGGPEGDAFRATGRLQVRKGGTVAWARPAEARYADRDNFPAVGRSLFALLDLPPRRSAKEVLARFGVDAMSRQRFSVELTRSVEVDRATAEVLRGVLSATLPFIKAYRAAHSVELPRLRRLERLVLAPVVEADLRFTVGEDTVGGQLDPGGYLLREDELLVVVDPAAPSDQFRLQALTAISDGLAELFDLQSGGDFEKLLIVDAPELRRMQLRRLLTNLSADEIDRLFVQVDEELANADPEEGTMDAATFALGTTNPGGEAKGKAGAGTSSGPAADGPSPPVGAGPHAKGPTFGEATKGAGAGTGPERSLGGVRATPITTNPPAGAGGGGGGGAGVRIGAGTGALGGPTDIHGPADAEQWAIMFEKSEGRHPVDVSRLQGRNAFGCDCLSFASEEDERTFAADPRRLDLVVRFIEVKSGTVRLTATEMAAARKHRTRYQVYRIQFDGGSRRSAQLTIVSDPLGHRTALSRECELRVDEIPGCRKLRLEPIER